LFALLLLPVLVPLGFWQLDRAAEKAALNTLYQQREKSQALALDSLDAGTAKSELQYQPVTLQGHYLNDIQLLLDNRMFQGQFGYEIITAFQLAGSERLVLVNRGWLAGDKSRRSLPEVPVISGPQLLQGEIHVSLGQPLLLGEQTAGPWPRVVQFLDMQALTAELGAKLFPYPVRIDASSPSAFQPNWMVVNMQPEKHHAYAFQWFAMAAAVVIIVLVTNTNIVSWLKRKR
jgi:cytochrome oxidase assembly protein ShyY1